MFNRDKFLCLLKVLNKFKPLQLFNMLNASVMLSYSCSIKLYSLLWLQSWFQVSLLEFHWFQWDLGACNCEQDYGLRGYAVCSCLKGWV